MKRAALIGIITMLVYSQVGYYFLMRAYQYHQKELVKARILSSLNRDELEIISLEDNKHKIFWEEDEEFLFNGEMYDLVEKRTINGKVMLFCINDKKEKELIDKYNSNTNHNSSSGKKAKSSSPNSISLFIDIPAEQEPFAIAHKNIYSRVTQDFQSVSPQIVSPPPKA